MAALVEYLEQSLRPLQETLLYLSQGLLVLQVLLILYYLVEDGLVAGNVQLVLLTLLIMAGRVLLDSVLNTLPLI